MYLCNLCYEKIYHHIINFQFSIFVTTQVWRELNFKWQIANLKFQIACEKEAVMDADKLSDRLLDFGVRIMGLFPVAGLTEQFAI